jgi:hypothetical protein
MAREKAPEPRSTKAGQPPAQPPASPRVRRHMRTVTTALRKGQTLSQVERGPRAQHWAKKPRRKKA